MELFSFFGVSVWFVFKIFIVLCLIMYLIFAIVVIRQVQLMTDSLELAFEKFIKALSWLHFLFAAIVLIAAILIL